MTDYVPKLLKILKWPDDEKLHQVSVDVTVFDEALEKLSYDLLATMKQANGVGLAAPQTGNMINMITVWIEESKALVLVNPVILETSEELYEFNEGCLSVPGYFEDRKRPAQIVVRFQNLSGATQEFEYRDLYAFVIQHEIDHLNGKVFVDHVSSLKKERIINKMKKVAKRK